ncbi:MAG: single-stranded-DNA-specific exonuclease RecJ [Flavobacteriaceae bacterium]
MGAGQGRPLFLDVERSLSGRRWIDRLDDEGRRTAAAIREALGIGELAARVVAGRGIGIDAAADYLNPTLRALMPDPDTLQDMAAASRRIAAAIVARESVAIFGDYDVDGACSSALLARYLSHFGVETRVHIPDRITEGYGPNTPAIDALAAEGAGLLITVDCGSMSHEALAHAAAIGLDSIVIDHHQMGETLPEALAVVNPNRADDVSGLGRLCAAGVVFMVLVAINRVLRAMGEPAGPPPDLMGFLDLVALATVCDVVPLVGLNRAFVARGLDVMARQANLGIAALLRAAGVSGTVSPYHLGFVIGPRINAGGRVGDAALGARLLTIDDGYEAERIAAELDRLNRERQEMERIAVEEAIAEADASFDEATTNVVLTSAPHWHPGIVGLVAARLKERFNRPAVAIAISGDAGTGSARSIPGVDLGKAVRGGVAAGVLSKGGGHAMAAGLTVSADRLGDLRAWLDEALADEVRANIDRHLSIDGALGAGAATTALVAELSHAEPYGAGNPEPVVVFPSHRLAFADATPQGHIRFRVSGQGDAAVSGIAFRAAGTPLGEALLARRGEAMHFAGALRIDRWQGRENVSLHLRDAALPVGRL